MPPGAATMLFLWLLLHEADAQGERFRALAQL